MQDICIRRETCDVEEKQKRCCHNNLENYIAEILKGCYSNFSFELLHD